MKIKYFEEVVVNEYITEIRIPEGCFEHEKLKDSIYRNSKDIVLLIENMGRRVMTSSEPIPMKHETMNITFCLQYSNLNANKPFLDSISIIIQNEINKDDVSPFVDEFLKNTSLDYALKTKNEDLFYKLTTQELEG